MFTYLKLIVKSFCHCFQLFLILALSLSKLHVIICTWPGWLVVQWRYRCSKSVCCKCIHKYTLVLLLLDSFYSQSLNYLFSTVVDCGAPPPPIDGLLQPDINTTEGSVVVFQCKQEFVPKEEMMTVCGHDGQWNPIPGNVTCSPSPSPMPAFTPSFTPNKMSKF